MSFICAALFAFPIVGAYETSPGWMTVHQLDVQTQTVGTIGVPTDDYLRCWEGPHAPTNSAGD
jgi:hypothetical protein